ncbi:MULTISPECIES: hypothetical protein [unclassified Cryobacterium]|uniref:hypothetical protein n=1 Tax=unclassified Cryobacterium TaxID=2649013 RepID=UPI00106CADD8|nr:MULTISPECIES: hypothetical protein [unclassified Cryobacterium]TFD05852.1 hypothetical protein E3T29_11080 [Cryobacterium sp. TMT1-66-1]TFD09943.1 hypothetical protein E3T35_13085 [Cryobacterium sp. TMT1-2-2]
MAFGDRGRYKSLATAIYQLLPDFNPTIEAFPNAGTVAGFPKEAVVFHPTSNTSQLVWIEAGTWKWKLVVENHDGSSTVTDDPGDGPRSGDLPARWALGGTRRYFKGWLADDQPAEDERAKEYRASLSRVHVEDMLLRVERLLLT